MIKIFLVLTICVCALLADKSLVKAFVGSSQQAQAALEAARRNAEAAMREADEAIKNGTPEEAAAATRKAQAAIAACEEAEKKLRETATQAVSWTGIPGQVNQTNTTTSTDTTTTEAPATTTTNTNNTTSVVQEAQEARRLNELLPLISAAASLADLEKYLSDANEQVRAAAKIRQAELMAKAAAQTAAQATPEIASSASQNSGSSSEDTSSAEASGRTIRTKGYGVSATIEPAKKTEEEAPEEKYEVIPEKEPETVPAPKTDKEEIISDYGVIKKIDVIQAGLDWVDISKKLTENRWAKRIDAERVQLQVDIHAVEDDMKIVFGADLQILFPIMQKAQNLSNTEIAKNAEKKQDSEAEYSVIKRSHIEEAGLDWVTITKKLTEYGWAKRLDAEKILLIADLPAVKKEMSAVLGTDFKILLPMFQKAKEVPVKREKKEDLPEEIEIPVEPK